MAAVSRTPTVRVFGGLTPGPVEELERKVMWLDELRAEIALRLDRGERLADVTWRPS
jgi:hypothetical protein